MATVPLSGTNIRLLSGVPFSNDFKHTRWHRTLDEQINYFNSSAVGVVYAISEANFQRQNNQTFIRIDKSIDEIFSVNYLRFQNGGYDTKWYYAFVTKLEYVQRNTTYVHFEIDVMQTYMFDFKWKPSFVVREHCKLWNSDGSPVINTIDEGLNYGTEYDTVYSHNYDPVIFYLVIVAKSTLHVPSGKTTANLIKSALNGSPQPLCYYVHPFRMDGTSPDVSLTGGINWSPITNILDVLTTIFSQTTAVNNIVSMYITEHIGSNITYDLTNHFITLNSGWFENVDITDGTSTIKTIYIKSFASYEANELYTGEKYYAFNPVTESKLLMYPYAFTVLDDFKGNRVVIKNEYVNDPVLYIRIMGSLGLSNKVAYVPRDYSNGDVIGADEKMRIALEHALINNNAQDVPILTDLLAAYLQGNKNALTNQADSIVFNGAVDTIGAAIGGVGSALTGNAMGVASAGTQMVKGAGNTVLQLQGMQAKIKDINNVPPQLAKMGSNTAFAYGNGYKGFNVLKKQIKPEYRKKLTDFFKSYGYKVNEVKIPNLYTRRDFNYIQTNTCNMTGKFNNEDLQEIKSVFDNGITLWHTNDIGNYDLTNPEFTPDPIVPVTLLFTGQAFGKNNWGQLGLGSATGVTADPDVVASPTNTLTVLTAGFTDMSFGFGNMVAIDAIGRLWSCGRSPIGLSTTQTALTMSTMANIKKVAACVQGAGNLNLKEDGTVWYVGFDSMGERAGIVADPWVATQIRGLTEIVDIQMGSNNCFALKANGDLYAWGDNTFGGIGNGSTVGGSVKAPTLILTGVKEIHTGNDHMMALKTNGELYAWGLNQYGACGLPYNSADYNIYSPTLTATNVKQVACGNMHSLYMANDGKVYSTGNPAQGSTATGVVDIPVAERDVASQNIYYHWIQNQFPTDIDGIACSEFSSYGWRGNTIYACGQIGASACIGDGRLFDHLNVIQQVPLINYTVSNLIERIEGSGGSGSTMILYKK